MRACSFTALLLVLAPHARAATSIDNEFYTVDVEPADGSFTLASKPSGRVFLSGGKLSGTGGTAATVDVADKVFGRGKGIEVLYPDGNHETISLHPGVPFVLFGGSRHNGGTDPVVLNKVPTVSGRVELGKPLSAVRTLGTGGLLEPAGNPGSYAFLAVADPETRSGVVGGWITHDRGSGVVLSPVDGQTVRIQAQIDYGRLRIAPGKDAALETFAVGYFDDARFGLEAYADAIAQVYSIKLPPHRPGYCTWYMEKHGGACDEKSLRELSVYAAKNLKPFGFGFIQIDDQWQDGITNNGPAKNFTTHRPSGPYPGGMKAAADGIKELGLTPGIWFMPFAGNHQDPYFLAHQDWFVKNPQGQPYETAWGGTCLDMTRPAVQEHLRGVVQRIAHEWGYRVFKLDGFWTGSATRQVYVNDGYNREDGIGDAEFFDPDKTNIEALRDGARLIRSAAGPDVFLLGCCVSQNMRSFGGSFGLLDAMRVGPDTGAGEIGAPHASRLWFLNGRVWWNDPDCVSVRAGYPLEQARLNATFTAIAGDLFYNSDWMPDFPPERLDILRRCIPAHDLPARPVDVFEQHPARVWHLAGTRGGTRRDVVALYNWEKKPATIECPAGRIGLPPAKEYVAFDFWANRFVPPFKDAVRAEMPPGQACRVLAVRPVSATPQLLSTSRHVSQGMVDVSDEKWDAAAGTLSAMSQVVGGDPYEIRIVVPTGENSWQVKSVRVSAEDQAAGVKAEVQQDGPKIRAVLDAPASRSVRWQVLFEAGRVDADADRWDIMPFVKNKEPILRPTPESRFTCPIRRKEVRWEEQNVYNPAAVVRDGKVYLLYRADDRSPDLGWGRTCRIGLAHSEDGIHFTRHPEPVLYPDDDEWKKYEWEGGCEDLHIVEGEDGVYYMNYTTWSGKGDTLSIATSRDLFHWTKHGPAFRKAAPEKVPGSRSGVVVARRVGDRLIAARIKDKFWMYYTHPCALAWSENLIDWTPTGEAVWGGSHEAGAIALLREDGILLLTQGGHPSLGAWTLRQALIDRDDLKSVLKEQKEPFLYPEQEWEKRGMTDDTTVANGMVPFKGRWMLYYGCGDRVINVATCPIKPRAAEER